MKNTENFKDKLIQLNILAKENSSHDTNGHEIAVNKQIGVILNIIYMHYELDNTAY